VAVLAGVASPGVRRRARAAGAVVATGLLFAYPLVVYGAMRVWGPRTAMVVMLGVLGGALLLRGAAAQGGPLRAFSWVPWLSVGLLALGSVLGELGFALMIPVAVNLVLLVAFAGTLQSGPPLIERFARMMVDDLHEGEVRWCRQWTIAWSCFFLANAAVAAYLAAFAPIAVWTLFTGLIGYALVGVMLASEYVWRKFRFGRLATHPLDRALAWVFARLRGGDA